MSTANDLRKTIAPIQTKEELKKYFEIVIGSCTREMSRDTVSHEYLNALNSFEALKNEAPGIVHYNSEQLKGFSREGLIEVVETLTAQGLDILDRLNTHEQDSEADAKVYLERQDLKVRTRKRSKIISAGRVTLNKELLEELNVGEGDVVDVYRYNVDGEFPKILLEFVTWRAEHEERDTTAAEEQRIQAIKQHEIHLENSV